MRIACCLSFLLALTTLAPAAVGQTYLWCEDADLIYAVVDGSTITVVHNATIYNCCPDSFVYTVDQWPNVIYIEEIEVLRSQVRDLRNLHFESPAAKTNVIIKPWFPKQG